MQKNIFNTKINHTKIHQIFYDWGFGFNELFKKSMQSFKTMKGVKYKLWTQKECEQLLTKYKEFKKLYYSCKFEIMKVDIIRFLILYEHGGLYADLDVIPVIKKLPTYKFAVSKNDYELNVEVILSVKKNKILLDYLKHIEKEIEKKDKIEVYKIWKLRYVHQTTGPKSFGRFLKGKDFKILKLNKPTSTLETKQNLNLKGDEEFISYPSCSYSESFSLKNYANYNKP